ncbi:MAG: hypothetical protein H9847_04725 [Candidatus Anaerobiospirillum pullicola]|uniref:Uncharacterized protein n=1 Tax=Candidatus Anaerobiospirillum pullicola TaxID=2838451 RepID=A0A948TG80_9GAMM|nr:hypothetical protein [Candidatus Anaerobiospirillum pullicola]
MNKHTLRLKPKADNVSTVSPVSKTVRPQGSKLAAFAPCRNDTRAVA